MITVYLVDDTLETRQVLANLVHYAGGKVVGMAANGPDALRDLELHPADLVITDFQMPEMTGVALARALVHRDPAQAVALVTVLDDPRLDRTAKAAGVRYVLPKPVTLAAMEELLRQIRPRPEARFRWE